MSSSSLLLDMAFGDSFTIFWVGAPDPITVTVGVIVIVGVVSVAGLMVTVTADAMIVTVAGGVYLCTDRSSLVVDE